MNTKFIDLFASFGFVLNNYEETFNVLNVDQRKFQSSVKKYLQESDENFKYLNTQLQEYLDDEMNFLVALLPTRNNLETVVSHSSNQDNLLKLLVEIEIFQLELFQYLIEKIIVYCEEESVSNDKKIMNIDLNVPTYIINQFRYQPKIFQPDEVCKKLMELVSNINSKYIKKEIILCFPDILSDSLISHDLILNELKELLSDNDLLSSVLETLSNLKFQNENIIRILDDLFAKFDYIEDQDLPFAIKFILKSSSSLNSVEYLKKLLNRIQLDETHIKVEVNRHLSFSFFKEYFQISTNLIELYFTIQTQNLSEIESSLTGSNEILKPIDFLIISIIYSLPQQFKQIDKLFKSIIKEDSVQNIEKSIQVTFNLGESILKELFKPITQMAKSLIDNTAIEIFTVGQIIYKRGFELLNKPQKHALVKILIENITCSNGQARDNCLDVLKDLCLLKIKSKTTSNNYNNPLVVYSLEIKALLNYIEYFNLDQIRKVYSIICSIAYSNQTATSTINASKEIIQSSYPSRADFSIVSNNTLQDNLHILINKQLSSNVLKFKQIGVIGALMMIENMVKKSNSLPKKNSDDDDSEEFLSCSENSQGSQNMSVSTIMYDSTVSSEIKQIWNMILDSSKSSPESLGLFEDDLTSLLRKDKIPGSLENLIKLNLESMTANLFKITDLKPLQSKYSSSFKVGYEFGLDEVTNGVLNLLPQIITDMQKRNVSLFDNYLDKNNQSVPSITICSTFRLFSALERKNIQVLKDYLGCPILTIKKDILYSYGNFVEGSGIEGCGAIYNTAAISVNNSLMKFKNVLNDEERKIICDSLFYIINWFTELVNAFSTLINHSQMNSHQNDLTNKLVKRLSTIIDLQQILANILPFMKHYRPPIAIFGLADADTDELPYIDSFFKTASKKRGASSKKAKKTTKKPKKVDKKQKINKENQNDDELDSKMSDQDSCHEGEKELVDSDNEENEGLETKSNAEVQESMNKIAIYFREFDLSVIKFVELELNTNPGMVPDTSENSALNRNAAKLSPRLLFFILNDVNKKLAIVLKPKSTSKLLGFPAKQNKIQLFLNLNNANPKETALFLLDNCFGKLCDNLDNIFKYIKAIQHKNDDIRDPPEIQNNQNNICLLKCFNQIIKLIHMLFFWLSSVNDADLSSKILKAINVLASKEEIPKKNSSISTQLEKYTKFLSLKYLNKLSNICLELYSANVLTQLMDLLFNKIFIKHFNLDENGKKKCRHLLAETCKDFLKTDFNSKIASKQEVSSNECVCNILNTFLKNSENPIEIVNDLSKVITGDSFREDRQACSDYETLKTNFASYFKVLLEYTVNNLNFDILKNYDLKKNGLDDTILVELVQKINDLVNVHCNLIYLKKHVTFKEINILTLLKNSRLFLNNFLKFTMPILDKAFDGYKAEVVNILQNIQKSVHFLQELCLAKDQSSISKQMPVYIRSIEAFALRVKQLLYVNSCDGAFTVDFERFQLTESKAKKKGKVLKERSSSKKNKSSKKSKHAEEEETNSGNEINDEDTNDNNDEEEGENESDETEIDEE